MSSIRALTHPLTNQLTHSPLTQSLLTHSWFRLRAPNATKVLRGGFEGVPIHFLHIPKNAGTSVELLVGGRRGRSRAPADASNQLDCPWWHTPPRFVAR